MFKKFISFLAAGLALCACGNVTNIAYIQDLNDSFETTLDNSTMLKARPDDKLSIIVSSKDPLLADLFNLPIVAHRVGYSQASSLSTSQQVSCYTVDPEGYIDFPIVGKIHIEGLTRSEIAEAVKEELISRDLIKIHITDLFDDVLLHGMPIFIQRDLTNNRRLHCKPFFAVFSNGRVFSVKFYVLNLTLGFFYFLEKKFGCFCI